MSTTFHGFRGVRRSATTAPLHPWLQAAAPAGAEPPVLAACRRCECPPLPEAIIYLAHQGRPAVTRASSPCVRRGRRRACLHRPVRLRHWFARAGSPCHGRARPAGLTKSVIALRRAGCAGRSRRRPARPALRRALTYLTHSPARRCEPPPRGMGVPPMLGRGGGKPPGPAEPSRLPAHAWAGRPCHGAAGVSQVRQCRTIAAANSRRPLQGTASTRPTPQQIGGGFRPVRRASRAPRHHPRRPALRRVRLRHVAPPGVVGYIKCTTPSK